MLIYVPIGIRMSIKGFAVRVIALNPIFAKAFAKPFFFVIGFLIVVVATHLFVFLRFTLLCLLLGLVTGISC